MVNTILRHTTPRVIDEVGNPRNNAGGPTHKIDMWARLNRFLILGTEGGTYYVTERDHTLSNVKVVQDCLDFDPVRTVNIIVSISDAGRAPKNDYAIYALALAAARPRASKHALANLPAVCRTGTHLFQFVKAVDSLRGWGPALRRAVANWYLTKSPDQVAYQVLKYQQREGWSHRDILRKVHPKGSLGHDLVFAYITKGTTNALTPDLINTVEYIKQVGNTEVAASAIRNLNVSREMIPTEFMNDRTVQEALAEKMPYTALIRNLGNLSRHGIQVDTTRITNEAAIKKSRVHPLTLLTALRTYGQGMGFRGTNIWSVDKRVTKALDEAFSLSFRNVEPTGKRFMVGVDVSGSMSSRIYNGVLTSTEVAAALSMTLVRTEPWVQVQGFNNRLTPLHFHRDTTLQQAMRQCQAINFGGTDAALLIDDARQKGIDVDVFVVITDNETWVRNRKPSDALREYREATGNYDAKLIVLATEATEFSIADPNDPGMLDIAGFDTSVPEIIREFALGNV